MRTAGSTYLFTLHSQDRTHNKESSGPKCEPCWGGGPCPKTCPFPQWALVLYLLWDALMFPGLNSELQCLPCLFPVSFFFILELE